MKKTSLRKTPWKDILEKVPLESTIDKVSVKYYDTNMPKGVNKDDADQDERIKKALEAAAANPIIDAFETEGINLKLLAKRLKKELNAKETKFFSYRGKVCGTIDVIAWDVRQRARQDAHKLRGDYPADKHEHTGKDGAPLIPAPDLIIVPTEHPEGME